MISQKTDTANFTLSVTDSFGSTKQVSLRPDQSIFAGTSNNCGLKLSGSGLSEIHCRLELTDGQLIIQDWMSATGTLVNGEAISAESEINIGDVIGVGDYRIEIATAVDAASAGSSADTSPEPSSAAPIQSVQADSVPNTPEEMGQQEQQEEEPTDIECLATDDSDAFALDIPDDFFAFEEEASYDHETVALLHAEIEELQAALAQRDAEFESQSTLDSSSAGPESDFGQTDKMLARMQELIDEANRSDERVALLEEMLLAAEIATRAEKEERGHLEGWVGDIEKRLSQREDEHAAEVGSLRRRIEESDKAQQNLHRKLKEAAFRGGAPKQYEDTLESLQASNRQLQNDLAESQQKSLSAEQKLGEMSERQERELREERVKLAQEQAKLSRMRFELSSKLSDVETLPKSENPVETETSNRIQALRAHLREIHEQEKLEEKEAPLTKRLAKLWRRVEY
ncbi:FHA domain-containing protein [Planctomycetes bacterium K23_9]|uniref:FHA domain protein n=1 Tax=Stieleria marina TaxID=1930275 RepID=A0A517NM05_9BACT|nr:FHA domain protein [Planctomycetes bacterium K23_9]